jgi:hypothetical protein
MRYLILAAFLSLPAGCVVNVHARDEATILAIEATAKNRASDAKRVQDVLAYAVTHTATPQDAAPIRQAAADLDALEKAEQARLANVIWREKQKTDEAPR